MSSKIITICPKCLAGIKKSEKVKCPECGFVFSPAEWPEEFFAGSNLQVTASITGDSQTYELNKTETTIGRNSNCDIFINRKVISKNFIKIEFKNDSWIFKVLNEKNVKLNGISVAEGCLLPGDILVIGYVDYCFKLQYKFKPVAPQTIENYIEKPNLILDENQEYIIGNDSNLLLNISGAASKHAKLFYLYSKKEWWILDISNGQGVFVNNEQIYLTRIWANDIIQIGAEMLSFSGSSISLVKRDLSRGMSIIVKNLSVKNDDSYILKNSNFKADKGDFVAIIGPSGCGKTSFLQRLTTLANYDSGSILVNGNKLSDFKIEFSKVMGYLPQHDAVHESLTLEEELKNFANLRLTCSKEEIDEKVDEKLKMLGLFQQKNSLIGKLSGGQKKRAKIAMELLREPHLLLLDEPTAGLDPQSETEVMRYLKRISSQGFTVICTTHILKNLNLCDKILVLGMEGSTTFLGKVNEAKSFFNVSELVNIFDKICTKESTSNFVKKYAVTPLFERFFSPKLYEKKISIPEKSFAPAFSSQTRSYLKRFFLEYTVEFRKFNFKEFFTAPLFIQIFAQPLIIAVALKLAMGAKFFSEDGAKDGRFFVVIAIFWLGMNNSVRELVKERVPGRALERLENVSMKAYLFAKLIFVIFLSIIQTTIILTVVEFLFEISYISNNIYSTTFFSLKTLQNPICSNFIFGFAVCFLISIIGGIFGFAVSSYFKKESSAISLLPIVVILMLLFSVPIAGDKDKDIEKTKIALYAQKFNPCQVSCEILNNYNDWQKKKKEINKKNFLISTRNSTIIFTIWLLILIEIILFFQSKNELKWDGRT